jgi:flagellar hook assembly protein FlgD
MSSVENITDTISSLATSSTGVTQLSSKQLDEKDFLTLLMAELQNQDPLNPVDNKDTILQLAQFSTLSSQNTLNANMEDYTKSAKMVTASSLIGETVSFYKKDEKGNIVNQKDDQGQDIKVKGQTVPVVLTAQVKGLEMDSGVPYLEVEGGYLENTDKTKNYISLTDILTISPSAGTTTDTTETTT